MAASSAAGVSKLEASKRFLALRQRPGNARCAECHVHDTSWIVLDYGVLICVRCAGAHRGLGTHISKVRSTQHDNFTDAELDWVESLSNEKSAALYEAALPATMRRPDSNAPDLIRRLWLRQKYDALLFTAGQDRTRLAPHERMRGWLGKQSHLLHTVRKRFFAVVGGAQLCYYTNEGESSFRGAWPLAECMLQLDEEDPLTIRLRIRGAAGGGGPGGGSGGGGQLLVLKGYDVDEAEAWAWAFYQCAYGAGVRAEEMPALAVVPKKVRGSLIGDLRRSGAQAFGGGTAAGRPGSPVGSGASGDAGGAVLLKAQSGGI